jgi:hypothetical protein
MLIRNIRVFRVHPSLQNQFPTTQGGCVMTDYHLAQINIARLLAPLDDPQLAEFVANLAPINALADGSPGFVWRFQTAAGDATSVRPYEDDLIIVNFSVWTSRRPTPLPSAASFHHLVYQKR